MKDTIRDCNCQYNDGFREGSSVDVKTIKERLFGTELSASTIPYKRKVPLLADTTLTSAYKQHYQ